MIFVLRMIMENERMMMSNALFGVSLSLPGQEGFLPKGTHPTQAEREALVVTLPKYEEGRESKGALKKSVCAVLIHDAFYN